MNLVVGLKNNGTCLGRGACQRRASPPFLCCHFPAPFTCVCKVYTAKLQANQIKPKSLGSAPVAPLIRDEAGPGCGAMQRALLHLQRVPASICAR